MSQAFLSGSPGTVAGFPDGTRGVTPPSSSSGRHEFLSEVIVELGLAGPETVEEAVEAAREPGMTVEKILLERGALDGDQLARAIAERHGLDYVDLEEFEVDAEALKLIARSAGLRYRAAPIGFSVDGALIVALEDPVDVLAVNDISVMTRSEVRVAVAGGPALESLIERLPDPPGQAAKAPKSSPALGALIGSGAAPSWSPDALAKPSPPADGSDRGPGAVSAGRRDEGGEPRELASATERDEALERAVAERERARQETDRASSERDRALEELKAAVAERDRLRERAAEHEQLASEHEQLATEHEQLAAELEAARQRADESECSSREAVARIAELEDADRRAETARVALGELRDELERERQQSALREEKLREDLSLAADRRDELEKRLARLAPMATEVRDALDKLAELQREDGDMDAALQREDGGAKRAEGPAGDGSSTPAPDGVGVSDEDVHGAWRPRVS